MSIVIGADAAGLRLKEVVKDFLEKENFHVVDVTAEGQDFVDVTLAVAAEVNKEEQNLGIVIDAYGAGPFIAFEPWSGLSTSLEEGDHLEDKKNVRLLEPAQVDQIGFDIEIF